MTEYTTISFKKDFIRDLEEYIEDEPFASPKEFVKHLVLREMEAEETISESEARRIGRKLKELGYME